MNADVLFQQAVKTMGYSSVTDIEADKLVELALKFAIWPSKSTYEETVSTTVRAAYSQLNSAISQMIILSSRVWCSENHSRHRTTPTVARRFHQVLSVVTFGQAQPDHHFCFHSCQIWCGCQNLSHHFQMPT